MDSFDNAPVDDDALRQVMALLGSGPASGPPTVGAPPPMAAPMRTPPFVAPPSAPKVPDHPAFDIHQLLKLVGPMLAGVAMHGPAQTGFLNGLSEGQQLVQQDKERKRQIDQQKSNASLNYFLDAQNALDGETDPTQWAAHLHARQQAGQHAGLDVSSFEGLTFNKTKQAGAVLKELTDQLDQLEKNGYNVDDLANSGSHLRLKDGTDVPIAAAVNITRKRPLDASGKPVAKPEKVGNTEEERFVVKALKDQGLTLDTATSDQELAARKLFRDGGRAPKVDKTYAPGGVDSQFNDLQELWKQNHDGQDPPADVRMKLRVQAKKEIGQADDRPPVTVNIPGLTDMTPAARVESAAQDLVNNRMAPSQLATFFTGMGKDSASQLRSLVMQRVKQLQPDFNFAQAEANYKFGSSSGTQGTVRFLDNIEKTLPVLQQASDDFKRSNVRVINKALLASKSQFGNTDVTKFEFARNILADEIAKILQGGGTGSGTSDAKLKQAQELLSGDMTPAQFDTALSTAKDLLGTRRESLTKGTFMEKKTEDKKAETPAKVGRFEIVSVK